MGIDNSVWFISAPANPTKQETVTKLKDKLSPQLNGVLVAEVFPFQLPDFKVGTLDSLMVLSDELQKSDLIMETIILKLVDTLKTLSNEYKELLTVGDSKPLVYHRINRRFS